MKIKDFKLGATGKFPQGKLDDTDEGELKMAISADIKNKVVLVHFGKPIAWLGLPVNETKQLIVMLNERIKEVEMGGD